MDVAAVLGEIDSFFTGGISATHHSQFLVAELRCCAIANGAGTDATAPELVFRGHPQPVGAGTCGNDHRVGSDAASFHFNPVRALTEIDGVGVSFNQMRAPANGLCLHQVHQIRTEDTVRKSREVLNVRGGHQLTSGNPAPFVPSDQQGVEIGACGINRGCVARGSGADDDEIFNLLGDVPGRHLLMRSEYELSLEAERLIRRQQKEGQSPPLFLLLRKS